MWFRWLFVFLTASNLAHANGAQSIPQQCETNCETRYGLELGSSPAGISAYSNCNSDCVIFEPNQFKNIYTGIKWQCVEYARRWLLHELGVVYGDVDIAADIWNLDQVTNPITGQVFKFDSMLNGSMTKPQRGDLLIYGREYLGTGHIAVVVAINEKQSILLIAEQNYLNTKWSGKFSREISYIKKAKQFWLLDTHLIGWKRVIQDINEY